MKVRGLDEPQQGSVEEASCSNEKFQAEASRRFTRLTRDLRIFEHVVLIKPPGFVAVAVIILALGIGANTVIFSLVNVPLLACHLPFTTGRLGSTHRSH